MTEKALIVGGMTAALAVGGVAAYRWLNVGNEPSPVDPGDMPADATHGQQPDGSQGQISETKRQRLLDLRRRARDLERDVEEAEDAMADARATGRSRCNQLTWETPVVDNIVRGECGAKWRVNFWNPYGNCDDRVLARVKSCCESYVTGGSSSCEARGDTAISSARRQYMNAEDDLHSAEDDLAVVRSEIRDLEAQGVMV